MSEIDRFSIVTLVLFFLSTIFVIRPCSFHVPLPFIGRTKFTIGLMSAPLIAILILWASQCIGATQIRDGIVGTDNIKPYNILILFISLAYMAITLDVTGLLQASAFWVSNKGGSNGRKLYLYFYALLTGISAVVGNDPIILSGTAFLVYYTEATGLDSTAWLISEFAAANTASMVLFVGNPTNVVICEGFGVNNAAFTAYTILPFLACSVVCYAALIFQFRSTKHVPKKLQHTGKLNPREVLRDPVSAIFGSILLLICLTTIIILSFFHVDVWIVVLPFAVFKFMWDICWDHYRYKTGKISKLDADAAAAGHPGDEDVMARELKRAMSTQKVGEDSEGSAPVQGDLARPKTFSSITAVSAAVSEKESSREAKPRSESPIPQSPIPSAEKTSQQNGKADPSPGKKRLFNATRMKIESTHRKLAAHFPTFFTALPRLPFGLIPFAFSQFILIEGLARQGWIDVFGSWLVKASNKQMIPVVWLIGVLGVVLCNIAGTNIGATILLTKIVHAAQLSPESERAAAVSLAVASNIGAVSFTFSASLAGLLWKAILKQKGIEFKQTDFAKWNTLPLVLMTGAGLAVVTAMMVVLYR